MEFLKFFCVLLCSLIAAAHMAAIEESSDLVKKLQTELDFTIVTLGTAKNRYGKELKNGCDKQYECVKESWFKKDLGGVTLDCKGKKVWYGRKKGRWSREDRWSDIRVWSEGFTELPQAGQNVVKKHGCSGELLTKAGVADPAPFWKKICYCEGAETVCERDC